MTNVEGRRPEGAPERSRKAGEGAASGVDGKVAKRFSVQLKSKVGETMDNELLYAKIAVMEGKRPLAHRRSKR